MTQTAMTHVTSTKDTTSPTAPAEPPHRALGCVIVEDQTMFLQLLVGMLRTVPGIEVQATATTAQDAIMICRSRPVDLLILDLVLPDGSGVDVLRAAVARRPEVVVIVLSSAAQEFACPRDLLPNLRAVIDKTEAYERLQAVISGIVGARDGSTASAARAVRPLEVLRPRELEVFQLLGRGLKTADIAIALRISRHTVETHRRNITSKLGVRGAELVRLATIHNQTSLISHDDLDRREQLKRVTPGR